MKFECANLRPDELLYSLIARSRRRLGFSTLRISKMIFGKFFMAHPLFAPRFDRVTKLLNAATGGSDEPNDLLQSSTMFKAASLGLPDSDLEAAEAEKNRSENLLMARMVNRALAVPHGFMLRACPLCVDDDRKQYGESHWHRMHQFPGLRICSKHHTTLWTTDVSVIPTTYVSLDEAKLKSAIACPPNAADFQKLLAADLEFLISNHSQFPSRQQIRSCYIKFANRSNALPVTIKNIRDRIRTHFPCGLLESIDPSFAKAEWATMLLGNRGDRVLPIYGIVAAARSLDLTVADFLRHASVIKPDEAPWPCKNSACHHYNELVVEIRHFRDRGRDAELRCPHCNVGYLRSMPFENNDDGSFQYTMAPARKPSFSQRRDAHRAVVGDYLQGGRPATGQLRYAKMWLRWHDTKWIESRCPARNFRGKRKLLDWPRIDDEFLATATSVLPRQIGDFRKQHMRSIKRKMLLDLISKHLSRPFPIHAIKRLPKTVAYVDTFVEGPLDVLPRRIQRGLTAARKCNRLPSLSRFRLMCGLNIADHKAYAAPVAGAYADLKASWTN